MEWEEREPIIEEYREGKGRSLTANRSFHAGEFIFEELPHFCHLLGEHRPSRACGRCLRSLETLRQQIRRCLPEWGSRPFITECEPSYQVRDVWECEGGCPVRYCSPKCRAQDWEHSHAPLCPGMVSEEWESEVLRGLWEVPWEGVVEMRDHVSLFLLLLAHHCCCPTCPTGKGWPGWGCLEHYAWAPWEEIPYGCPPHLSAEAYRRHKQSVLVQWTARLGTVWEVTEEEVSRGLGVLALNCADRTPEGPLRAYVRALLTLPDPPSLDLWAPALEHVTAEGRGEGLFREHSALNHSCAPNCLVTNASLTRDARVVVEALEEIEAGEELTISYIDPTLPVLTRQQLLWDHYSFRCNCSLCVRQLKEYPTGRE